MPIASFCWIALCLVAEASARSVESIYDGNDLGLIRGPPNREPSGNEAADVCKFKKNIEKCRALNGQCTLDENASEGFTCSCKKSEARDEEGKCIETCPDDLVCQNDAKCVNGRGGKFCRCLKGTSGHYCEETLGCNELNCGPDAICVYDRKNQNGICSCQDPDLAFDYGNGTCRKTCTDDLVCENEAECVNDRGGKFCRCLKGTYGHYCEHVVGCEEHKCHPDAICVYDKENQNAKCMCNHRDLKFDYESESCREPCGEGKECEIGGECIADRGRHFCRCSTGLEGHFCEIIVGCKDLDCGPDARCTYDREKETADCACNDPHLKYDYGAKTCTEPCGDGKECHNDGKCIADRGGHFCRCSTGLEGHFCEIIVGCEDLKCGPDARCTYDREKKSAKCTCNDPHLKYDYGAKTCTGPSTIGSTSYTTRNSTTFSTHLPTTIRTDVPTTSTELGRTMLITKGSPSDFSTRSPGKTTSTGTSPCTENPCQNGGTCVVLGNRSKCLCRKPYLGILCETDPCDWNPCKNGGLCKTGNGTYKCYCKEPYTGEFCETRMKIDAYVITLVAASVFSAIVLIFVACVMCQRHREIR